MSDKGFEKEVFYLMEMWVAGKGQKKRPGVRSNSYIGRKSLLECNGIIKIYL